MGKRGERHGGGGAGTPAAAMNGGGARCGVAGGKGEAVRVRGTAH
jgi:hypothetical protein